MKSLRSSARSMAAGRRPHDADPGLAQGHRQVERGLAAELENQAQGLFRGHDVEHVFFGQGLEIEFVGGVVVGGHGFGVGVDHDGLYPDLLQGEGGLAATVVELDALADAVGAAAQDHDLVAFGAAGLVFPLIGGVKIGGVGFELGGAGVHQLVDRIDAVFPAHPGDMVLVATPEVGELPVGEAPLLGAPEHILKLVLAPALLQQLPEDVQFPGETHQVANLVEEPGVDPGYFISLLHRHTATESLAQGEEAVGVGDPQQGAQFRVREFRQVLAVGAQAEARDFEGPDAFLQGLLEGAADGHHLPHGLHGGGEKVLGPRELFKGPARNLDHAVVNGGFKGGVGLTGDVVVDLVQGESHRQLGRNLGDGKARGLGGQGRGAGDPGVHFDDHHLAVFGVDGKLNVGAAGFHPDFPDDGDGRIPHGLVLPVGEGLGRGHGDGIAGVHPHGVQVFDGADDHHVVLEIPHHFQFEFLPAHHRLFQHHLGDHAGCKAFRGQEFQVLQVVGDAAAGAPQGEAGPHDDGVADVRGGRHGLIQGADDDAVAAPGD